MIEALGWIALACLVMVIGKAIGKKIWPEDWEDKH
jgi:hypothetical protein|tara:strand:+ start:1945 stop:2049 length:105 start_codon:yes stop_codon:yes gene_type:complete